MHTEPTEIVESCQPNRGQKGGRGEFAGDRSREEFLELLFAHVADGIFLIELDGRVIDVNPAACAMLGYAGEELLGMRPWDFVTSASAEEILKLIRGIERAGPVTVQLTYRRKTGEERTMDLRLTQFGYPGRDLVVAFCRDLTEQKQLEKGLCDISERQRTEEELYRLNAALSQQAARLRQVNQTLLDSEQRLRLAIETGKIGLWVWNSTDVKNSGDWSNRLKEIFGLPSNAEVTHDMFLQCVHPEDRERVDQLVMQALGGANGGEYRAEYRTIRPRDGSEHWVTARGQAFFNSEGKAIRFIGTVMDITERKRDEESSIRLNLELEQRIADRTADLAQINQALQIEIDARKNAEEALKRSEDYLRLVIDTIPGLVWSSLPDGHVEYLNKRWTDYTGLTLEQASGWGWEAAIHPEDLPGLLEYRKSILASGTPGETEARMRRFDGEYRYFLFRDVPLYGDSGNLVKWYGTNTDIEALQSSEKLARGQLEALTNTLTALSKESEPEKFLEHILRAIGWQLGAHSLGVWGMNDKIGRMELVAVFEEDRLQLATEEEIQAARDIGPAPRNHPVWTEFFRSGEHCVFGEIRSDSVRVRLADGPDTSWYDWFAEETANPLLPVMAKRLSALGILNTVCVPMFIGGKVTGLTSIRFQHEQRLCCGEVELARALAQQAMLAIQLMRLSQQSRQAAVIAERNRLAREIHDTLAQGLTGVIVQLEAAEDAQAQNLTKAVTTHIERAGELARESLQEARRSVHALRPLVLAGNNLCAAIKELIGKMTAGTNLRAEFTVQGEAHPLPRKWEENLLRASQEVLTNTLRHARASQFNVHLVFDPQTIRMELRDDGCGFDPAKRYDGFGLLGIRERVEMMGGELTVQSAAEKGTAIFVVVPLVIYPLALRL
jgi:PAS domain S-box-containing protein